MILDKQSKTFGFIQRCNLLEDVEEEDKVIFDDGKISLDFSPFQIRSVLCLFWRIAQKNADNFVSVM